MANITILAELLQCHIILNKLFLLLSIFLIIIFFWETLYLFLVSLKRIWKRNHCFWSIFFDLVEYI